MIFGNVVVRFGGGIRLHHGGVFVHVANGDYAISVGIDASRSILPLY